MTEPIARIEAALTRLGAEHEPPVGWQARVLAATAPRRQRRWWWFAVPGLALAALAVVAGIPRDRPLTLAYEIEKKTAVVRGAPANLGDVVHATVTGGQHDRAVWVYRNDQLLVACPGAPQCRSDGAATIADITLTAMGTYTIVALTSSSPLPAPTGSLDADLGKAQGDGATTERRQLTVH